MTRPIQDIQLGKSVGKIPSGLFILTLRHGEVAAGALLSWVQQAGFEPLTLSVAIAKGRSVARLAQESGLFALSVLGQSDMGLMKHFARGVEPSATALEGINLGTTPSGQPYLADALAWLECRVNRTVDFGGDHDLVIVEVTAGQVLKEGQSFTHVRGSGSHY